MADIEILEILGGGRITTVALCSSSDLRVAVKMYHRNQMTSLNERQVHHQKLREFQFHEWLNVLYKGALSYGDLLVGLIRLCMEK